MASLFAQTDVPDDFDSLFDDAEDSEGTESSAEEQLKSSGIIQAAKQIFSFYGSFVAEAAYSEKVYDREDDNHFPGAALSYTFGISMRPSSNLSAKCALVTSFPNFGVSVSSLYFDYVLFNRAYLTVGKTTQTWGNSAIFTTDILSDTTPLSLIMVTVPIKHGSFEASANLKSFNQQNVLGQLYYAASFEYPFKNFSYKVLARTWATENVSVNHPKTAFGFEISGDIFKFHTSFYGDIRENEQTWESWTEWDYGKFVCGIGRYWDQFEDIGKFGFVTEYQLVYNTADSNIINNALALTSSWRHLFNSRYSLSLAAGWNITNGTGYTIPAVSISGLPHATVYFATPLLFGKGASYIAGDNATYTLTSNGNFAAFLTTYITLSFSY